jgi:hypothetical protein
VEESYLNVDGGRGWVDEYWSVFTNDGWTTLAALLRRKSIGEVTAVEERFNHLPPRRKFYRVVKIEAPIGTLVMKRVRRSEFNGEAKTVLELRGEERLARPRAVEERVDRKSTPTQRLPVGDTCKHLEELLSQLEKASSSNSRAASPSGGLPSRQLG